MVAPTGPDLRALLASSSPGSTDREILARALRVPLCWPADARLAARAERKGFTKPRALAGQTGAITVSPSLDRATLWLLEAGATSRGAALTGDALRALEEGRALLHDRFSALLGPAGLDVDTPSGRVAAAAGPSSPRMDGRSLGLALALSTLSAATASPVASDALAIADLTEDGRVRGVDRGGMERKLALLARVALGLRRLIVSHEDAEFVDNLVAGWSHDRPRVLAMGNLSEVLDEVFPRDVLARDPARPRTAVLNDSLRDQQQAWRRAEARRTRYLPDSTFTREFADLFRRIPLHDPLGRPVVEVTHLVSLLGFSWQPAALMAARFRPQKMLLLGTPESVDVDLHGGRSAQALVAEVSGLPLRRIAMKGVPSYDEQGFIDAIRTFVAGHADTAALDLTAGKKSMTAAAALIGQRLGMSMVYVDYAQYSPDLRLPIPGTEYPRRLAVRL